MFDLKKHFGAFAILLILVSMTACGPAGSTSTATPQITATSPIATITDEPTWTPAVPVLPTVIASATPSAQLTTTVQATAATAAAGATAAVSSGGGSTAADKYLYLGQSVADGKQFRPGVAIAQTWSIKNAGTTTWTKTYALRLFAGPASASPATILLGKSVAPGASISINATITTPGGVGDYDTWYKLTNDQLQNFGDLDFKYTVTNNPINQIQPTKTP
jgi:hypothetical protein